MIRVGVNCMLLWLVASREHYSSQYTKLRVIKPSKAGTLFRALASIQHLLKPQRLSTVQSEATDLHAV